jgi:hypothetical protein
VLQDVDLTLGEILGDNSVPPSLTGVDLSFVTPDQAFTPTQLTLNFFLHGVHENRVLRDPVPIVEELGGAFVRRTPPLRVDCDYLVTAWSSQPAASGVEEAHRTLARALMKLSRFPLIPASYLQNSLVGQPFPVQMWVAQSDDSKSLGEFWSALGMPPRPSFHLMVTIAMDLQLEVAEGPPVTTKQITLHNGIELNAPSESVFGIGGVVRDAVSNAAIADATVTVDGRGSTSTDLDGRYRLAGLAAGTYTLQASATGFTDGSKTITVPAAVINAYDIDLSP